MPLTPSQTAATFDSSSPGSVYIKVSVNISNTNNFQLLVILELMTQLLLLSEAG